MGRGDRCPEWRGAEQEGEELGLGEARGGWEAMVEEGTDWSVGCRNETDKATYESVAI